MLSPGLRKQLDNVARRSMRRPALALKAHQKKQERATGKLNYLAKLSLRLQIKDLRMKKADFKRNAHARIQARHIRHRELMAKLNKNLPKSKAA